MDDYINRKAVRDALYEADAILMRGVKILNQFPASDVVPVRHGKWIDSKEDANDKDCIVCNHERKSSDSWWKYCPNCGTKMDLDVLIDD